MRCSKCGSENPAGKKYCSECGVGLLMRCPRCNAENAPAAKFCGECGASQFRKCPDGHEVPGNMKFCPECGKPVQG